MEHYNNVARTLMERPDRYSPLFSVDTRNGDIPWRFGSRASRRPSRCVRQPGRSCSTPMSIRRRR
jgi:hypothetical protein